MAVMLIQTKKISRIPIVLYGKDFWTPLLQFFDNHLLRKYKTIDPEDMDLFHLVDTVEEAFDYIVKNVDPTSPRQI